MHTLAAMLASVLLAGLGADGALGQFSHRLVEPVDGLSETLSQRRAPPSSVKEAKAAIDSRKELERLAGTWLFDVATEIRISGLGRVWHSTVTIAGDSFTLTRFMDSSNNMLGTFVLNSTANPKTVDLTVQELDLSDTAPSVKVPACTLLGIYRPDGDQLTICFTLKTGSPRPTAFDAPGDNLIQVTLEKTDSSFQRLPEEVKVNVVGMDGRPAVGAVIATFMTQHAKPDWEYRELARVGDDGSATVQYAKLFFNPLVVRDPESRSMAIVPISPASLARGIVDVQLKPECRVTGVVQSETDKQAAVYVDQGRRPALSSATSDGEFEFVVPPGAYELKVIGRSGSRKSVGITIPDGRKELALEAIELSIPKLEMLKGRLAPELEALSGWKGDPVRLADLRGRYVLLEFWGYWCGPCVRQMPTFIELHEKLADKGLAIVAIHVDSDGEVDTVAKLEGKIAGHRKNLWKGKDLPFPVALAHGNGGEGKPLRGPVAQYGVSRFPTTVLIDPQGRVVGEFHVGEENVAHERIENLLKPKK